MTALGFVNSSYIGHTTINKVAPGIKSWTFSIGNLVSGY